MKRGPGPRRGGRQTAREGGRVRGVREAFHPNHRARTNGSVLCVRARSGSVRPCTPKGGRKGDLSMVLPRSWCCRAFFFAWGTWASCKLCVAGLFHKRVFHKRGLLLKKIKKVKIGWHIHIDKVACTARVILYSVLFKTAPFVRSLQAVVVVYCWMPRERSSRPLLSYLKKVYQANKVTPAPGTFRDPWGGCECTARVLASSHRGAPVPLTRVACRAWRA